MNKTCKICGVEKDESSFRHNNRKCKPCIQDLRRVKNGVKYRKIPVINGMKVCNKCRTNKPIFLFSKCNDTVKPRCKLCSSIENKKYRKVGKYRFIDRMFNRWIQQIHYRIKVISNWSPNLPQEEVNRRRRVCTQAWKLNNPDYHKLWSRKNADKAKINWHIRSVAIRDTSDGSVTTEALKAMMYKQNYLCNACHVDIANYYHIDHIIPISKEGRHTIENIQLLCAFCNVSKHNRSNEEFLSKKKLYT